MTALVDVLGALAFALYLAAHAGAVFVINDPDFNSFRR